MSAFPKPISSPEIQSTVSTLSNWLNAEARMITDTAQLDEAIVHHLLDAGLPITRYLCGVPSLHPQVDGFSTQWEKGKGMQFREHHVTEDDMNMLRGAPIFWAFERGQNSRHCLLEPPAENESSVLTDLREMGMTDYLVLALPFSDGSHKGMTFATDAADGFSDTHVGILHGLAPALAATAETRYLTHLIGVLMDTYVGPVAGRKVLAGAIKRGSSETIHAVIWFCDLKGFTALSERLAGDLLLTTLNDYFAVMTMAIEAQGGEVLKFIGDAILAIFQCGEKSEQAAAQRALRAANDAVQRLATLNESRQQNAQPRIECGIALHFGDALYGNVGGMNRLDFTVIGPAVNLASRIESLTRELQQPILTSRAFTKVHGGAFDDLGAFSFKGITEKRSVFMPSEVLKPRPRRQPVVRPD